MTGSPEGLSSDDERLLRRTFALAKFARNRANGPYGALCARKGRVFVEAENTEAEDDGDLTCHAEMNVIRKASREVAKQTLAESTLYASTEPCPMCAATIARAGIKRVVYGASGSVDCRAMFSLLSCDVEVIGPLLEEEARAVFRS